MDNNPTRQENLVVQSHIETKNLSKRSVEKVLTHIKSKLRRCNFYNKWILDEDVFRRNAEIVFEVLTKFYDDASTQNDDAELKYNAFEIIGKRFSQLYISIFLTKSIEEVEKLLYESRNLVNYCIQSEYVSADYRPGLIYVWRALKAYFITNHPSYNCDLKDLYCFADKLDPATRLTVRGLVAILALRHSFLGSVHRTKFVEQNAVLEKMIQLDPTNGDWYLFQYNIRRFERRQLLRSEPPDAKEVSLISTAANLSPKNPMVLIRLCVLLAEIVRNRGCDSVREVNIGFGRTFQSSIEIVQFLKVTTRKYYLKCATSVNINIDIAAIFSSILPVKFSDTTISKQCLEAALRCHPHSSKAQGKMGVFLLRTSGNVEHALDYFTRSFEQDRRNFPTITDILFVYLSDHARYFIKIRTILRRELENPNWSDGNLGTLQFIKGLECFLQGNVHNDEVAIDCWMTSFSKYKESICFENFSSLQKKYKWCHYKLRLERILKLMRNYCSKFRLQNEKEKIRTLELIMSSVQSGIRRDRRFRRQHRIQIDSDKNVIIPTMVSLPLETPTPDDGVTKVETAITKEQSDAVPFVPPTISNFDESSADCLPADDG